MARMTFKLGYSVLASGYTNTKTMYGSETIEQAIEAFYENWESDGSSREELGDVWDMNESMLIENN